MKAILFGVLLSSLVSGSFSVEATTEAGHRDQRNPTELFAEFKEVEKEEFCVPTSCGEVEVCCPKGGLGICSIIVPHLDCQKTVEELVVAPKKSRRRRRRAVRSAS